MTATAISRTGKWLKRETMSSCKFCSAVVAELERRERWNEELHTMLERQTVDKVTMSYEVEKRWLICARCCRSAETYDDRHCDSCAQHVYDVEHSWQKPIKGVWPWILAIWGLAAIVCATICFCAWLDVN